MDPADDDHLSPQQQLDISKKNTNSRSNQNLHHNHSSYFNDSIHNSNHTQSIFVPFDPDIELNSEQIKRRSSLLFIGGFFFLPWLWLVNFWYGWEYFDKPDTPSQVKFYTRASLAGFVVWCIAIIIWLSVYLTQHDSWGAKGDNISITIPNGS